MQPIRGVCLGGPIAHASGQLLASRSIMGRPAARVTAVAAAAAPSAHGGTPARARAYPD